MRDEPEVVNDRAEEDPQIVEAILNIKDAIRRISPMTNTTFVTPELNEVLADLEQAVRFLEGKEEPS